MLSLGFAEGCVQPRRPVVAAPVPSPRDEAAQRSAYELGVRRFAQEKYVEARAAWREAVRLGPRTALGGKSLEHLKKLDRMLATLAEIQQDAAR